MLRLKGHGTCLPLHAAEAAVHAQLLPIGRRFHLYWGNPEMANVAMEASKPAMAVPVRAQLQTLEDGELVASFLAGEERAFQELVERYQTRLLNFIYRTIGDRERGEDLVQEVFIRVYRHMARFDRSKKFSTWIYTIASNLAKNELRNRSRNPLVFFQTIRKNWQDNDRPLQFEDANSRPDDLYRRRHLRSLVEASVARLPEHHRQVFDPARARRQVVRGDRGDHELQPGYGKVAAEPRPERLRPDHRAGAAVRGLAR